MAHFAQMREFNYVYQTHCHVVNMYEVHSKSIRPWSIKKRIVYISQILFNHLQSTPIGISHTSPSGAATSGNISGMP